MNQITTTNAIELTLLQGDLSKLNPNEKLSYFKSVCESVGLNPLTKPFEYIKLNGKEVLYATKGCAEQLRATRKVSLKITNTQKIDDVYVVTVEATDSSGRTDSSTGAVTLNGLKGDALANALMKAETKAKRRVTLSICGLNMLDELEVETINKSGGNGGVISMTQSESKGDPPPESKSLFDKVLAARPSVLSPPDNLQVDENEPVDGNEDTITRVFELEPEYENNNNVHAMSKPNVTKVKFPADPGDYVLPFQKGKHVGKKLKEIPEHDLKGTLKFCDEKGMDNISVKIREYLKSIDSIPF